MNVSAYRTFRIRILMKAEQPVIVYAVYSFVDIIESDLLRCFRQRNPASALTDADKPCLLKVSHDIPDYDRIYTNTARQNAAGNFFVFAQIIYDGKEMDSYCKLA